MVQGKKLVGSAQKRTRTAVLQHGSIPLDENFRRLGEFMATTQEEKERIFSLFDRKCTWVGKIAPAVGKNFLAECLAKGFEEGLEFEAFKKPWTAEEELKIIAFSSGR